MSLQLLPEERDALVKAVAAIERIYGYCKVMIDRGSPLDDIDGLADIHASSACLSVELAELLATFDGVLEPSGLLDSRRRVLLTASEIVQRMEGGDSVTAARLRVLSTTNTKPQE